MRTIVADCVDLFFGEEKETKYCWGIRKMFETVVDVELLKGDKRAVCDTCRYRLATKSCKSGKAFQEWLLKRKRPISPLSSNEGDKETEKVILR